MPDRTDPAAHPFRIQELERRVNAHESELRAIGDRSISNTAVAEGLKEDILGLRSEVKGLASALGNTNKLLAGLLVSIIVALVSVLGAIGLA